MNRKEYIEVFIHNIKWLMINKNVTVNQMAQILKTTHNDINLIEQGILPDKLRADVIVRISEYFNIPIKDITEIKLK